MESTHTLDADWFMRHRLKLRHLKVAQTIDRTHNIGRAAAELHTSQPAVSKAVQELERAAGLRLFERRAGGTFPTVAGDTLLRYAREVFGALERAGKDLQAITHDLGGSLSIGCNFSSAGFLVPQALVLMKRANPGVAVRVQEGSLEMLLPELRSRKLDLVVARWPRGRKIDDLEEHALFDQPMCIVCAPDHPLAGAKSVTWKQLGESPWILPPEGSAVRHDLEELFRQKRIVPRDSGIECASPFATSVLLKELQALAISPLGIARHLESDRLFAILTVKLPRVFGPNSVITLRGREHGRAVNLFVECLGRSARRQ